MQNELWLEGCKLKLYAYEIVDPKDKIQISSTIISPKYDGWQCYLYGSSLENGMVYQPIEGCVPNWFVRWMMNICLGCRWVKNGTR